MAGRETLVGETTTTSFTHEDGLRETWSYRVRAVDGTGNIGNISGEASATTGLVLAIEAELLLPEVESTAPVVSQEDCRGVQRSGGAQVWFQAASAGDHFTLAFAVPQSGAYDLSAFYLRAPDYGIHTVALDGAVVGEPFDGYGPGVVLSDRVSLGNLELSAGQHMLTFTVTGTNSASSGFFVGVDLVELELVD